MCFQNHELLGLVLILTFVGPLGAVAEVLLHELELAGGSPGAFVAQRLFRHKISKKAFQRSFWGILTMQASWEASTGSRSAHRASDPPGHGPARRPTQVANHRVQRPNPSLSRRSGCPIFFPCVSCRVMSCSPREARGERAPRASLYLIETALDRLEARDKPGGDGSSAGG